MKIAIFYDPEKLRSAHVRYVFDHFFFLHRLDAEIEYTTEFSPSAACGLLLDLTGGCEDATCPVIHLSSDAIADLTRKLQLRVAKGFLDALPEIAEVPVFALSRNPMETSETFLSDAATGQSAAGITMAKGRPVGFIAWNFVETAFHILSCRAEYLQEKEGREVLSYHARMRHKPFEMDMPVVSIHFEILKRLIEKLFHAHGQDIAFLPRSYQGKEFAVCLVHDVDAPRKTLPVRARRLLILFVYAMKNLLWARPGAAWKYAAEFLRFAFSRYPYLMLDEIVSLEERHGMRSTFSVYARTAERPMKARLVDPDYDVAEPQLREALRRIAARGAEICLHGGYGTKHSREKFAREKQILEQCTGASVIGGRQHWLDVCVPETFRAQAEAGLRYDCTLQFNDCPGFRAGSCHPFVPFDFDADGPVPLLEVPPVLMDSTLFNYYNCCPEEAWERSVAVLRVVKALRGCCCIVWHQESFSKDYGYGGVYEKLLQWIRDNGGAAGPVREMAEAFLSEPPTQ